MRLYAYPFQQSCADWQRSLKFWLAIVFSLLSMAALGCGSRPQDAEQLVDEPPVAQTKSSTDRPGQRVNPTKQTDEQPQTKNDTVSVSATLERRAGERLPIAVLEFEDTSPVDGFARLNRALQSMLTTDLSVSQELKLVERARLADVLQELNLVQTGFLDAETAAKLGKGVGAQALLTGSFWVRGDTMRIDARLIHVETGTVIFAEEITGVTQEFTTLEKRLANKVLETAGIHLSETETTEFSRPHTSSLLAASRYGQALVAEDSGDFSRAERAAAAAIEADPEFALAAGLRKRVESLLRHAQEKEFRRNVLALARFEDELNGYPFVHSRFRPKDYPQILKENGPDAALLYWLSYCGVGEFTSGRLSPYDQLFAHPNGSVRNQGRVGQIYLELGAAEAMLFWCKIANSNPDYAPQEPLTDEMLNPNPLSRPAWGPYPAYFFWRLPDVYHKQFRTHAEILGDWELALESLESMHTMCRPLVSERAYVRELERLNETIRSPRQLQAKRQAAQRLRQLWQIAHEQILIYHVGMQNSRFGPPSVPSSEPDPDIVRKELIRDYAERIQVPFGGRSAREQRVSRLVDSLLEEAEGAKFVARQTLIPSDADEPELVTMMHLSGCPHSYLSRRERRIRKIPTGSIYEDAPGSGFEKVEDPEIGLQHHWVPCPHCRPLRWAEAKQVQAYLAKRLPKVIDRVLQEQTATAQVEMENLLTALLDHPTMEVRPSLRPLCEHLCQEASGDRTLHALALRALSKVATPEDAAWLIELLQTTPWWDARSNVAATLASIDTDRSAAEALREAIQREPYYFVRHTLEAAQQRLHARLAELTWHEAALLRRQGEYSHARSLLRTLVQEIEQNDVIILSVRGLALAPCHWRLGQLSEELGESESQIDYFRQAIQSDPTKPRYKLALAGALARQNRNLEEAEQLLQKAKALQEQQSDEASSQKSTGLAILGLIRLQQGHYAEAKQLVLRCLQTPNSEGLEIYSDLGDIHWALGENAAALAAWKKALEFVTDSPKDQALRAKIETKLKQH